MKQGFYSVLNLKDILETLLWFSHKVMSVWLWNPMGCSMPGFFVPHYLLEFAQTHVHWVSDAVQPSHPLLPPSPPALNLSQHQDLYQWVGSSHVLRALQNTYSTCTYSNVFHAKSSQMCDFQRPWRYMQPRKYRSQLGSINTCHASTQAEISQVSDNEVSVDSQTW